MKIREILSESNQGSAEDKWSEIGFSVRSDILWPSEIFESSNPQESGDFFSWLKEQRSYQKEPKKGSECILAMISHTGKEVFVIYGIAKYIGQSDSHYQLKISSGVHQYSKKDQIVFSSKNDLNAFLILLALKFGAPTVKKMSVMETPQGVSEDSARPAFMKAGNMQPKTSSGKEKPGAVDELKSQLLAAKKAGKKLDYDSIDGMMQRICHQHNLTGDKLHDDFVKDTRMIPDNWIKKQKEVDEAAKYLGPTTPVKINKRGEQTALMTHSFGA